MAEKLDPYRSYGQKLISLFARLLFSGESHSLIELSKMLGCSKQTVLRLVDDIRRSYGIEIDEFFRGRKKFYQIRKTSGSLPVADITGKEMMVLQMCRAFTEHLMGRKLFEEAAIALGKSRRLMKDQSSSPVDHFASILPGTIDYTRHHQKIFRLAQAMDEKRVCRVSYRKLMATRDLTFYIKPLKLFSRRDTIYLHAALARTPGKPYREPEFNPLLAVHRISSVELTDRSYNIPEQYDFESDFNLTFGVMKDQTFRVEAEFFGRAARFVSERTWSPDQKMTSYKDGRIKLKFTASSEPEIISWILSFGDQARLLKPTSIRNSVNRIIEKMQSNYDK